MNGKSVSKSVKINRRGKDARNYTVVLDGLTKREILAMKDSLQASKTPVASYVLGYLETGLRESDEPQIQRLANAEV